MVTGVEEAFKNPYRLNQNAKTDLVDNIFNSSLSVNYAGRAFNFSSQTAYQSNYRFYDVPIDADFSPADAVTLINNYGDDWNKVKVLTEELRFTSPNPVVLFEGCLVMILITPAIAFLPYNVPCGPLKTSIRSTSKSWAM